jgi:hypothetical protein
MGVRTWCVSHVTGAGVHDQNKQANTVIKNIVGVLNTHRYAYPSRPTAHH